MANFADYLPTLLRFEGGFVDDPQDPGGATNMGITLKTFQAHGPKLGLTDTSVDALKRLTREHAGQLYKLHYWDALKADSIPLQALAELLVDFYVNAGGNAIRELQRQLNATGTQPPLDEDGQFGASTATALLRSDLVETYRGLRRRRIEYYERLVKTRPVLQKYLKGWLNRVDCFPVL
ncbi:hypothetical protein CDN99_25520 [Roseateles aquatilis]|uniref:Uncharacterized protein n=1 Tax=Roseateles aquatilis TaxID=431061 RepID=A0A246IUC1_9BURK|nr:glycosyl hydrolase 108 family protein [Roseateles aquatilis]OWQ83828.1 hypothetical protein CDN99_25520 [Roseateles aquatilis]